MRSASAGWVLKGWRDADLNKRCSAAARDGMPTIIRIFRCAFDEKNPAEAGL